jgi:hypothetical protein
MCDMREARVTPLVAVTRLTDATRERLLGRTIWNVNSTETGGGVAEMLRGLIPTAMGL